MLLHRSRPSAAWLFASDRACPRPAARVVMRPVPTRTEWSIRQHMQAAGSRRRRWLRASSCAYLLTGNLKKLIETRDLEKIARLTLKPAQDQMGALLARDAGSLHQCRQSGDVNIGDQGQVYRYFRRLRAQGFAERAAHLA